MRKPDRFWDWIANRYAKQPVADEDAYQTKLAVTRDYLKPDMNVLEFACGTGSTAIAHAPHCGHILALDGSRKMIEIANRKLAQNEIANARFEQSLIEDFDAPEGSFDMIMGHSILHLLRNMEEAIEKTRYLLKPGGLFVTSTACMGDMKSLAAKIASLGHYLGVLPYLNVFTSEDLLNRFTDAGFEIEHRWQPGEGKSLFVVARKPA